MPLGTLPILQIGFIGMQITNFGVLQAELQIQLSASNIKHILGVAIAKVNAS